MIECPELERERYFGSVDAKKFWTEERIKDAAKAILGNDVGEQLEEWMSSQPRVLTLQERIDGVIIIDSEEFDINSEDWNQCAYDAQQFAMQESVAPAAEPDAKKLKADNKRGVLGENVNLDKVDNMLQHEYAAPATPTSRRVNSSTTSTKLLLRSSSRSLQASQSSQVLNGSSSSPLAAPVASKGEEKSAELKKRERGPVSSVLSTLSPSKLSKVVTESAPSPLSPVQSKKKRSEGTAVKLKVEPESKQKKVSRANAQATPSFESPSKGLSAGTQLNPEVNALEVADGSDSLDESYSLDKEDFRDMIIQQVLLETAQEEAFESAADGELEDSEGVDQLDSEEESGVEGDCGQVQMDVDHETRSVQGAALFRQMFGSHDFKVNIIDFSFL